MKLNSKIVGAAVVAVIFGGILLTSALGFWHTTTTKVPNSIKTGEAAGALDPEDIRGSYSFGEISSLFEIPLEDLQKAFMLPADIDPAGFQNKELEALYPDLEEQGFEIGNNSVKLFVAFYKNLPLDLSEDIYLLRPAVDILNARVNLTAEQTQYLGLHTIDLDGELPAAPDDAVGVTPEAAATPETTSEEHTENERMVNGNATFQDLLSWGVSQTEIEAIIGGEMPNPLVKVKDYCVEKELPFSEIKALLQAAVDTKQ